MKKINIFNTLRHFLNVLLLLLLLVGVNTTAWGADPSFHDGIWYSLYDANVYDAETWKTSGESIHTYSDAFVPNDGTFSFEAKLPGDDDSGKESSSTDPHDWGVENFDITFAGIRKTVNQNVTLTNTKRSGSGKWYDPYRYTYYYSYNYQSVSGSGLGSTSTSFEAKYEYKLRNTLRTVYVRNVKVPVAKHILLDNGTANGTVSITNVNLGAESVGQTSATSYHINLRSFLMNGTQIRFVSNNEDFHFGGNATTKAYTVLANSCAVAGGKADCASDNTHLGNPDNYEADVYFTPRTNKTGASTATITIYDGNTVRATITFTANVLPTYYFKATAVATDGSQDVAAGVKASFSSGSYTSASVTTNEIGASTNTANITKLAYFYAPAQQGDYYFQGWYADAACTGTRLSTGLTLERDITATSLRSESPTEGKYYALYKQIIRAEFSGAGQSLMVDGSYNGISYIRTSRESAGTTSSDGFWYEIRNNTPVGVTTGSDHPSQIISYDPSTRVVTAHNAGTATLVLHQEGVGVYEDIDQEYTFTVYKYNSVFANVANLNVKVDGNVSSSYTLTYEKPNAAYIGDANHSAGTPVLGASESNFYYTLAQDVQTSVTAGSDQPTWAIAYSAGSKTATGKNAGKGTVHLYQPETYKYNAADASFDVNVTKYSNSISCFWDSWSKNLNFDQGEYVSFTTSNTNYTATPVVVSQTSGTANATYYPDQGAIYTSHNIGSATWSVYQPEDYKYVATDTNTLTVNVGVISNSCDVYSGYSEEKEASKVGDIDLPKAGIGDVLYFQMRKNQAAGDQATLRIYGENNNLIDEQKPEAEHMFSYTSHSVTLPAGAKKIQFAKGGTYNDTDDPYIKDIRISRKSWLTLQGSDGSEITSLTMPLNTTSTSVANSKTVKFYIDYSVCAEQIKVASNNAKITVSDALFSTSTSKKEITVTYTSNTVESISATITVYTPDFNKTLTINAQTVRQTPVLTWASLYKTEPVVLPITFSDDAAVRASNESPITYSVEDGEESIIQIAADGHSFRVIGVGVAHLTATTQETELWRSISETKLINTSDKKIQNIRWSQDFTRSLSINEEKTLEAKVYVLDLRTGVESLDEGRTAYLQYSCPENNGVIEMVGGSTFRVIGYGTTSITASVDGDDEYEAATSVSKTVRVRELQTGDCDPAIQTTVEEITFYAPYDLDMPEIIHEVALNTTNGKANKLVYEVRGKSYDVGFEYYNEGIEAYESTDNGGSWTYLTKVYPSKNTTLTSDSIQLSPTATNLRFRRPKGGRGYHYVTAVVTMLPELEVDNTTMDLGSIAVEALYEGTIPVTYSNVKGDMAITATADGILSINNILEAECGTRASVDLPFTVIPTETGPWSNTVTITDTKQNLSVTVTLTATITKGKQTIIWNPSTEVCTLAPPVLGAVSTSGLEVSYEVTAGTDVAHIENGEVIIDKTSGEFTITASQTGDINYNKAPEISKTFTIPETTTLVLTAPTASDITYPAELRTSALTGGSATANGTPVAGSWTWKEPTSVPEVGDAQEITVVFTPSANECLYTGFETTATINVKRAQFVFDGSGEEEDDPKHVTWCYEDNWNVNQRPGSEDEVLIDHNVVIRQEVSVYSVTINEGDTLTIMPTGGLTVGAGGITVATTGKLILKAGTAEDGDLKGETGYLRISPEYTGAMPQATVELYSIGYTDMATGDAAYQYVGSPVQGAIAAKTVFNKSVLQAWNEEQGKWYGSRNSLELNPFTGYITTQTRNSLGWLITNAGQLVANENITINLSYTATSAEPGCNVLANSFAAPIDLTKFIDDDFHNIDSTIYLFNTGSRNDMEKKGVGENARGQYLPLPIGSLRAMKKAFKTPTVIAPMQGFCVNALNEGAYITLNYERLVWGGTESNTPLRVKKQEEDLGPVGALCISLVADNMGDNLYLLESEEYDILFENGYDARKRMSGELNVFSIAGNEKLGVDATNSIIGTRVGVRTGEETAYTFVFSHLQSENGLALYDAETEQTIDIDENTEYTFFAAPETEITDRFQIVAREDAPAITTGVDGVENEAKAVKFIKDDQIYILKNGVLYNAMGAIVR